ncbi:hypothetical protein INR49_004081 [Caranx melampygus]|nr:hypothetical protein INR49_004081 [Caranx melampygus]
MEALQLSHPAELELKKAAGGGGSSEGRTQTKLSLNPIYRQVPRVLERCCSHIETHGLQTVGIFRVGSSKKRVRQLREDFDMGVDVQLDEEHSVHDSFAQDTIGTNDEEVRPHTCTPPFCRITGNKMTAANLAVIFGPNLLQRERGGDVGIEDSTAIISVTLVLIQNHRRLFMGNSSESGGRRDTGASLDSVGASSGNGSGSEGSLTSEVFLNVLKLNQNRKRQEARYGEVPPGKSIRHMRQFHSHHNLLSLAQPSSSSSSTSRLHSQDSEAQDRRGALGSALSFSLSGGVSGSCSSLSGSSESSIWVRQMPQEESKPSPTANFWDFFTGKGSGSETMV